MVLARVGDNTGGDSIRLGGADREEIPGSGTAEVNRVGRVSPAEG